MRAKRNEKIEWVRERPKHTHKHAERVYNVKSHQLPQRNKNIIYCMNVERMLDSEKRESSANFFSCCTIVKEVQFNSLLSPSSLFIITLRSMCALFRAAEKKRRPLYTNVLSLLIILKRYSRKIFARSWWASGCCAAEMPYSLPPYSIQETKRESREKALNWRY